MDKEAQEKIARYMRLRILSVGERTSPDDIEGVTPWAELSDDYKRNYWLNEAIPILEIIYELGYRKLPEGKPLLLSGRELRKLFDLAYYKNQAYSAGMTQEPFEPEDLIRKGAQVQREADIKHYEKEEK